MVAVFVLTIVLVVHFISLSQCIVLVIGVLHRLCVVPVLDSAFLVSEEVETRWSERYVAVRCGEMSD